MQRLFIFRSGYLLGTQEICGMRTSTRDGRFDRREYRGWKQSESIIHDGQRSIWNYNRSLVRQSTKLIHSSSQSCLWNVGGSAIYEFETKARDLIAADRMVDTLFVFNARKYSKKPILLLSCVRKCVFSKLLNLLCMV